MQLHFNYTIVAFESFLTKKKLMLVFFNTPFFSLSFHFPTLGKGGEPSDFFSFLFGNQDTGP